MRSLPASAHPLPDTLALSPDQFLHITNWLYRHSGIRLRPGKEALVRSRLAKRLRLRGCTSYADYIAYVQQETDGQEFAAMIDALCTNTTHFLRERAHFDVLEARLRSTNPPRRMWSAGCSSGEEAYSMAMSGVEHSNPNDAHRVSIVATDLSQRMIDRASTGFYSDSAIQVLPPSWRERYWAETQTSGATMYQARPLIRERIRFARLNLMDEWSIAGPFDVIFCRNVMIYFDKRTQQRLVGRFHALLAPGGLLFVGHSESLSGLAHRFTYTQPAVYQRS